MFRIPHWAALALLFLAATIGAAPAELGEGELARLPRPRPATVAPVELSAWADAAEDHFRAASADNEGVAPQADAQIDAAAAAIESLAPLPRPRPPSDSAVLALMTPPKLIGIPTVVEADDPECPTRLRALGAGFTEEPAIDPLGECSVAHPLNVTSLGSGVAVGPQAILTCRAAESLALWVREALVPTALERLGTMPTSITHSSTYVCRPRNNIPGAKISEHAHANAVDIAAINFAGRAPVQIGVNEAGSAEARFEDQIRAKACDSFTTVLGPGSDAAHAVHLHFDMAKRRSGYRLCELGAPTVVRAP